MFVIIGLVVVLVSIIGGYMGNGGHLGVLMQPFELVIILGSGIGAFITANGKEMVSKMGGAFGTMFKGPKHNREAYVELLCMMYAVFKLAKSKGDLALESHVDRPEESSLFQKFPHFLSDHHSVAFLCDYLRLLTLGTSNSHEVEAIMEQELETHHDEAMAIPSALQTMADGLPALGIVAAVLGVIHTMGSITEPPEILGGLIGAALVGTFSGVLFSYGFVGPMAASLGNTNSADGKYFQCMKAGIIAHMQGYAPQVSVEFARKTLPSPVRPSFTELEESVQNIPPD